MVICEWLLVNGYLLLVDSYWFRVPGSEFGIQITGFITWQLEPGTWHLEHGS
jgi:hypothetical protein